jgi:hypothetical protein
MSVTIAASTTPRYEHAEQHRMISCRTAELFVKGREDHIPDEREEHYNKIWWWDIVYGDIM